MHQQFSEAPLDLLVVAPHPDDAEISVGGTILKTLASGARVGVVDLTSGEPTPRGTVQKRIAETAAATQVLGLSWRKNLDLPNRRLVDNEAARRSLAGLFRLTKPKLILAPYWEDAHPDHVAATSLIDAARFWAKLSRTDLPGDPYHPPRIFYYWSIHLRIHPQPAFIVDISEHIEKKMQAIRCFSSQMPDESTVPFPTMLDDIRDRARYWGWAIGKSFGEPFASREGIAVRDILSLV